VDVAAAAMNPQLPGSTAQNFTGLDFQAAPCEDRRHHGVLTGCIMLTPHGRKGPADARLELVKRGGAPARKADFERLGMVEMEIVFFSFFFVLHFSDGSWKGRRGSDSFQPGIETGSIQMRVSRILGAGLAKLQPVKYDESSSFGIPQ